MATCAKLIDLLTAGYHHNSRAIQRELYDGENPNLVHPIYGVSAMHLASGQGNEATQLLLLHGGDPNVMSVDGLTPLHVAASWGDWKALQLLLKNGADVSIQDQDGKTAYDLAVESNNVECVQILGYYVKKPVNVSVQNANQEKVYENCCEKETCHRDLSVSDSKLPSRLCSDTVTERVYRYLEEGKKVYFDATSPNNPTLGIKQSKISDHYDHNCSSEEHLLQSFCQQFQGLQYAGVQNTSLSPNSHTVFNGNYPIHNHCAFPESFKNIEAAANSPPPYAHLARPVHTERHFDKPATYIRPHILHGSCGNQFCLECYSQASCNSRFWFRKNGCSLHSMTLPCDVKPTSPLHLDMSCTSVNHREYMQVGERCHCYKVAHIDTPGMQFQDCDSATVFQACDPAGVNNKPVCQNWSKTFLEENVMSQNGRHACNPFEDMKNQKESNCIHRNMSPAPENISESVYKVSSREIFECNYDSQVRLEKFSSGINFPETSSQNKAVMPLSDYCSAEFSDSRESFCKKQHDDDSSKANQDRNSSVTLKSGKLFPPLYDASVQSLCFDESTSSEVNDNLRTRISSKMKKTKRRSLLKPQETSSPLPKSHMKPQERVAEFILSVQNYMSSSDYINDSFTENLSSVFTRSDSCAESYEKEIISNTDHTENVNIVPARPYVTSDTSQSSVDTFTTCVEGFSDSTANKNSVTERDLKIGEAISTQEERQVPEESTDLFHVPKHAIEYRQSRWKPPTSVLPDVDITSDESFDRKAKSRVYRMKIKHKTASDNDETATNSKPTFTCSRNDQAIFRNDTKPVTSEETAQDAFFQTFPLKKRLSSDSLFSSISVKEYVYRDKEKNITLIERHIPSDCGSSIGRRSLDSTASRRTIDSEATMIYDWRALNEVLKSENPETQPLCFDDFDKQCTTVHDICPDKNVASLQESNSLELSSSENTSCTTVCQGNDGITTTNLMIPAHLQRMTCEEVSQELQKYGEIPGPVIPATKQAYLRRLTALQSNPGLVVLSKACPDYPSEMRQALNGQFDISGLAELESKMVDVFNAPKNGNCWREGTAKSSFTYLLLDPRITDNLPLRSKNMNDIEVFKTFICSIFYIGKGKRSRPYCHLYEAVSAMSKANTKMNAKVKQIIDIWNAGLGVVSLHCFQSVIPVEAYTREACMIQAIGLHKLTNLKQGDIYGAALSWTATQRRKMGVYLLKKTLQIFLAEGERQICLPDLKNS